MPKKVDTLYKRIKKQNPDYDDSKAWATAWSIYCKYVNPDSDHCQRSPSGYFKKKKKKKKKSESIKEWFLKIAKETVDLLKE
jgi:restriction endonuclease